MPKKIETATPQLDFKSLPQGTLEARSPLRNCLDDYLNWGATKRAVSFCTSADISAFVAFNEALKARRQRPLSLVVYVARCLAVHLIEHRYMMTSRLGRGLWTPDEVNMIFTVSVRAKDKTPLPLLMQVRGIEHKTLPELSLEFSDKVRALRREALNGSQAIDGGLWLGRRSGLTRRLLYASGLVFPPARRYLAFFSSHVGVTSLTQYTGARGGWGFPVSPHSCHLTLGGQTKRAIVVGDEVVARPCLDITVAMDHAITDGAKGLAFTDIFVEEIESGRLLEEFADAPSD